jgi:hypothetical protein
VDTAARDARFLDADAFLRTDQSEFGSAWRYELVRGRIIAHAAPRLGAWRFPILQTLGKPSGEALFGVVIAPSLTKDVARHAILIDAAPEILLLRASQTNSDNYQ